MFIDKTQDPREKYRVEKLVSRLQLEAHFYSKRHPEQTCINEEIEESIEFLLGFSTVEEIINYLVGLRDKIIEDFSPEVVIKKIIFEDDAAGTLVVSGVPEPEIVKEAIIVITIIFIFATNTNNNVRNLYSKKLAEIDSFVHELYPISKAYYRKGGLLKNIAIKRLKRLCSKIK